MISKPIALIEIPNQRLFGMKAAAHYLGVHEQTLRKLVDLGLLEARRLGPSGVHIGRAGSIHRSQSESAAGL